MAINFAAASTAGLNNPGTEIITLVFSGSNASTVIFDTNIIIRR